MSMLPPRMKMSENPEGNKNKKSPPGLTFIKRKNPPLKDVVASLRELESQLPKEKRGGVTKAISIASESED